MSQSEDLKREGCVNQKIWGDGPLEDLDLRVLLVRSPFSGLKREECQKKWEFAMARIRTREWSLNSQNLSHSSIVQRVTMECFQREITRYSRVFGKLWKKTKGVRKVSHPSFEPTPLCLRGRLPDQQCYVLSLTIINLFGSWTINFGNRIKNPNFAKQNKTPNSNNQCLQCWGFGSLSHCKQFGNKHLSKWSL